MLKRSELEESLIIGYISYFFREGIPLIKSKEEFTDKLHFNAPNIDRMAKEIVGMIYLFSEFLVKDGLVENDVDEKDKLGCINRIMRNFLACYKAKYESEYIGYLFKTEIL